MEANLTISIKINNSLYALTQNSSSSNVVKRNNHMYVQICMCKAVQSFSLEWQKVDVLGCWCCHNKEPDPGDLSPHSYGGWKFKVKVVAVLASSRASFL